MANSRKRKNRAESTVSDGIRIRGFARLQIGETQKDGTTKIVGDSGWLENTITNTGRNHYIAGKIGSVSASSSTPTHLAIATQTAAIVGADTSLVGEVAAGTRRKAPTISVVATGTMRMTASWSSTDADVAYTIGSIAVYATSAAGTMGSGQTYTTSQWNTNQDLSATYEWRFVAILGLGFLAAKMVSMLAPIMGSIS